MTNTTKLFAPKKTRGFVARCLLFFASLWSLIILSSCGFFGSKTEELSPNDNFRRSLRPTGNTVPLPVEIVQEIARIETQTTGQAIPLPSQGAPAISVAPPPPTSSPQESIINSPPGGDWVPVAEVPPDLPVTEKKSDSNSQRVPSNSAPQLAPSSKSVKSVKSLRSGKSGKSGKSVKPINYKVQSGDTLMKISFAKYGNIYRWREIYETNREQLPDINRLAPGTVLVLNGEEFVVIRKNGTPYLIRRGDTLGKISQQVYQDSKKWPILWKNNSQLIKDPNKIYAGFTLYYRPLSASEKLQILTQEKRELLKPTPQPNSKAPASVAPPESGVPDNSVVPSTLAPAQGDWVPAQ